MSVSLHLILLIFSFVCAVLAACGVSGRIHTGWAAFAFFVAAILFGGLHL